jgi:hypothetical protein
MADTLDFLRKAAMHKRINGFAGGKRVLWTDKDLVKIYDRFASARSDEIISAAPTAERKLLNVDRAALLRSVAEAGITVRDIQPDDSNFLYIISSARVDLSNDDIDQAGIDFEDYKKNNPAILDSHDSSVPPIAVSSSPWLSGGKTMAIAKFPRPGVSADSDRVAAAIRGGLIRGASIGFVPLKWSFTKDPSRPLGISFRAVRMIEFSTCAIPCNSDCLLIGAVSGGKSASDVKIADRRREARVLVARATALCASIDDETPAPTTRDQRIAEAQALRRMVKGR